jgi:predicted AlkP superfamily phosphohydrolase/phosphomutase
MVIIGLDGGTFDIIKPLAEKGRLRFFNRFLQDGSCGVLRSTHPPVTAPAWTSFMTGKNPGKHGLFDFQRINDSGEKVLTYSTDCKSATIWDYLGDTDIKILLVNIPMTYPPMPVNGICISGFPVPHNSCYVFPEDKFTMIKASGYITDWTEILQKNRWRTKANILREVEKKRIEVFANLLKKETWNLSMIVVSGTDHISHLEWQKGNRRAVENYYVFIDHLFNKLDIEGTFTNTSILVMSDHGFTQSEYVFYMNVWLMRQGYLTCKMEFEKTHDRFAEERQKLIYGKRGKLLGFLGAFGLTRENVIFFAKKTGLIRLESYLPHQLVSIFPSRNIIPDWKRTRAYMISNASKGLNINLQGREKNGIVSIQEYEALRLDLIKKLKSVKLPDGSNVFEYVDIRENIYSGPFCEQAPDIILWPSQRCNVKMGKVGENYLEKITEAHHTMEGIFMFKGHTVRKSFNYNLGIEDLAPTIMHFLGLSCPNDMDGVAIKEIFEPLSEPALREVVFRDPLLKAYPGGSYETEESSVINQLKALGYL